MQQDERVARTLLSANPCILTRTQPTRTVFTTGVRFFMSSEASRYLKFGSVTVLILISLGYLAYTGVQDSKSYYVTIKELHGMGSEAYSKRLRVAGNVVPGSIKRSGTRVDFMLKENDLTLPLPHTATEPPPTTF